jgi:hypothetical protein
LKDTLQSLTSEEYGDRYREHFLEQYKLYVATSQQLSERRQQANNYLLTLNSSLMTVASKASLLGLSLLAFRALNKQL